MLAAFLSACICVITRVLALRSSYHGPVGKTISKAFRRHSYDRPAVSRRAGRCPVQVCTIQSFMASSTETTTTTTTVRQRIDPSRSLFCSAPGNGRYIGTVVTTTTTTTVAHSLSFNGIAVLFPRLQPNSFCCDGRSSSSFALPPAESTECHSPLACRAAAAAVAAASNGSLLKSIVGGISRRHLWPYISLLPTRK